MFAKHHIQKWIVLFVLIISAATTSATTTADEVATNIDRL